MSRLLDSAVRGVQRGEVGHTVVIQGVSGAGKTALLREYVIRLLAGGDETARPIIPVPLRPNDFVSPPAAILQEIDRQFRELEASTEWRDTVNRMVGGASLVGYVLFILELALAESGYVERRMTVCRPALPSLASHLKEMQSVGGPSRRV